MPFKRWWRVTILIVIVSGLAVAPVRSQIDFSNLIGQVSPAVVWIINFVRTPKGPLPAFSGSGFIINSDGYVLTNAHVVDASYPQPYVVLRDNPRSSADDSPTSRFLPAAVVRFSSDWKNTSRDMALLKIITTPQGELPGLPAGYHFPQDYLGDSSNIVVGEHVFVIGYPLEPDISKELGKPIAQIFGSIHNLVNHAQEALSITEGKVTAYRPDVLPSIQTDAVINSGNSGGPVFNVHGQVIGIATLKYSGYGGGIEGLAFAIGINETKPFVPADVLPGIATGTPAVGFLYHPLPDFSLSIEEPWAGEVVIADASGSKDPDGTITQFNWDLNGDWDFGDIRGEQVPIIFPSPIQYSGEDDRCHAVRLEVVDQDRLRGFMTNECALVRPSPLWTPAKAGNLRARIFTDMPEYKVGEPLKLYYSVYDLRGIYKNTYVYVFHINSAGQVRLFFPNKLSQDNFVCEGRHPIPDNSKYSLRAAPPEGTEFFQVIASTEPLDLGLESLDFPVLGRVEQVRQRIEKAVQQVGRVVGGEVASAYTSFKIVEK